MTSDNTSPTSCTSIQVDGQVKVVTDRTIERIPKVGIRGGHRDLLVILGNFRNRVPIVNVLGIENLQGGLAYDVATHHGIVKLNTGKLVNAFNFLYLYILYRAEILVQCIGINPGLHFFLDGILFTVSKSQTN